ncbi:hypothetical protein SCHPADRAFT_331090 [Schizopora paradoxa]|uniref:Uncharacterized protein n=1 Tax=Schizopora paradoxa TaxID=27342 RepID=A0A0H2SB04_9AGAM|nr:hypothetical protein SCHPADRAFT_331090 [Schizopora paradoxa]
MHCARKSQRKRAVELESRSGPAETWTWGGQVRRLFLTLRRRSCGIPAKRCTSLLELKCRRRSAWYNRLCQIASAANPISFLGDE